MPGFPAVAFPPFCPAPPDPPPEDPAEPDEPYDPEAPDCPGFPDEPVEPPMNPWPSFNPVMLRWPPETMNSWVDDCPSRRTLYPPETMLTVSFGPMPIGAVNRTSGQLAPYCTVPPRATADARADSVQFVRIVVPSGTARAAA
ncbi:MAG: hypothetical protein L3K09_04980 [Thermoplasmata archaeon]|nr:hypothetical protein [Thermoplasmata archaeon]